MSLTTAWTIMFFSLLLLAYVIATGWAKRR